MTEIDEKAKICPNCKKSQGLTKPQIVAVCIVSIIIFIGMMSNVKPTTSDDSANSIPTVSSNNSNSQF
jgi:hypothetical protein